MAKEIKNERLLKAIAEVGEEQAAMDLEQGTKNRVYRKTRGIKMQAYQEVLKADPRFKQIEAQVKKQVDEKLKRG